MHPSEILTVDAISVGHAATSKKRILEEAAALLATAAPDTAQEFIYERLLERERLGSTGIGHGAAIPHARIQGLTEAYGAFIQLTSGADFDAIDGEPVDLVFALVVPQDATEEHLQLLAQLAFLFSNERLRKALRASGSAQEIFSLVRDSETLRQDA